jgi:hypothetical protein
VAADVRLERGGVRVAAELRVRALAVAPDEERRRRDPPAAERARGLALGVIDAREARRDLVEELVGGLAVVGEVDADERDFVAVLGDGVGEVRELRPARRAPRRPLIDDDRMALELRQPRLEGVRALTGELVRVGRVDAQGCRRLREPCRGVSSATARMVCGRAGVTTTRRMADRRAPGVG